MSAATGLADLRRAAERAGSRGDPFACLVSARGHAELGQRSRFATGMTLEWRTPSHAGDEDGAGPDGVAATVAALRGAAKVAFERGAKGLLLLATHEAAAEFDRMPVHGDWRGLPRLQLWSAREVVSAPGGKHGGAWGTAASPPQLELREDISTATRSDWHRASVEAVLAAIAAGRLYQLCLTFPVRFAPPADPAALFAWLVSRHPVDYAAWVSLPGFELLSASPERFLSLRGRTVTLRPMKGTRGLVAATGAASDEADIAAAMQDLATSVKDRAENVMIADLARNDLGRVCVPGSVSPAALFEVERYASVAQMTSTIRGELRDGLDVWDAFAAAFPPGSMTGAPKIESCRMIRELEGGPRGLYGGVLGWIEPGGDAEFSVVIRSLQSRDGEARWDIGGGIVHDSTPDAEWAEAWAKFAPLRALSGRAKEGA